MGITEKLGIADTIDQITASLRNPDSRKQHMALLRSAAVFVGSIVVFRNFGDLMAV